MYEKEGLIKFQPIHIYETISKELSSRVQKKTNLPNTLRLMVDQVQFWHHCLSSYQMIGGKDPQRYHGDSFGNLSIRLVPQPIEWKSFLQRSERADDQISIKGTYQDIQTFEVSHPFLVTGTQTGHLSELSIDDLVEVYGFSLQQQKVLSRGVRLPSSESLTHAAIYQINQEVSHVFHVHSPEIWLARSALNLPETSSDISYGTHEMALAIQELVRTRLEKTKQPFGVLAMGGHIDGIISYGTSAEQAGDLLLSLYQQSF